MSSMMGDERKCSLSRFREMRRCGAREGKEQPKDKVQIDQAWLRIPSSSHLAISGCLSIKLVSMSSVSDFLELIATYRCHSDPAVGTSEV